MGDEFYKNVFRKMATISSAVFKALTLKNVYITQGVSSSKYTYLLIRPDERTISAGIIACLRLTNNKPIA